MVPTCNPNSREAGFEVSLYYTVCSRTKWVTRRRLSFRTIKLNTNKTKIQPKIFQVKLGKKSVERLEPFELPTTPLLSLELNAPPSLHPLPLAEYPFPKLTQSLERGVAIQF